jgi:hypothetical protein
VSSSTDGPTAPSSPCGHPENWNPSNMSTVTKVAASSSSSF